MFLQSKKYQFGSAVVTGLSATFGSMFLPNMLAGTEITYDTDFALKCALSFVVSVSTMLALQYMTSSNAPAGRRDPISGCTFFKGPSSDDTRDHSGQQNGFSLIYNSSQTIKNFEFVTADSAQTLAPADVNRSASDMFPWLSPASPTL